MASAIKPEKLAMIASASGQPPLTAPMPDAAPPPAKLAPATRDETALDDAALDDAKPATRDSVKPAVAVAGGDA